MSIASYVSAFLTNSALQTMSEAQTALLLLRNITIPHCSRSQSRSLWYSLMIYKFKSELNISPDLWQSAREFILTTLRGQDTTGIIKIYLDHFAQWKERDFQCLIKDMATFYVQLLEIKDAIERTGDRTTITHWQESYHSLITKVKRAARHLGCLDQMKECAVEIQRAKQQYVFDMMHRAYWDMMEEDLVQSKTTVLVCHLQELRDILMDINVVCPLDFSEISNVITKGEFGKDEAWDLFGRCMHVLRAWDSESHERIYNESLVSLESQREETTVAQWIRMLLEKSTVLALDLKIRKALWKLILTTEEAGV